MWTEWSRSIALSVLLSELSSGGLIQPNSTSIQDGGKERVVGGVKAFNCSVSRVGEASEARLPGGGGGWSLLLALVLVFYVFLLLERVCEGYFVPCIKIISFKLGLSGDVAGATLMAGAVSSPDLFINTVGTFLTEGDIGVGTVFGCGVLNMLLIPALSLFLSDSKTIKLDWWPVTRDSLVYGGSLVLLSLALRDNLVHWNEALLLVIIYLSYILIMSYDRRIRAAVHNGWCWLRGDPALAVPLLPNRESDMSYRMEEEIILLDELRQTGVGEEVWWEWAAARCWWLATRPVELLLRLTVPRPAPAAATRLCLLTFLSSLLWVAASSYLVAWILTLAGWILHVPDSMMGLTLLAIGMSVPGVATSVIVAKQGDGGMAVGNALGSNTFDVLICLGLPWLVKAGQGEPLELNSRALPYSSLLLLSTLAVLYLALATTGFTITKQLGVLCLVLYCCFIVVASLLELNVLFLGNLPACPPSRPSPL